MSDPNTAALTPQLEAEELRERGVEACLTSQRIVLEIGFGRADLIMALAEAAPDRRFLGVEVSRKRVEKAARRLARREISNVRLVNAPAEYLLERVLPAGCVEECWINCPDPWPKKRHHRRRLVQPPFLKRLAGAMCPDAVLHLSTDHEGYRDWIHDAFAQVEVFENLCEPASWSLDRPDRPQTAYEEEWLADGRTVVYFDYRMRPR